MIIKMSPQEMNPDHASREDVIDDELISEISKKMEPELLEEIDSIMSNDDKSTEEISENILLVMKKFAALHSIPYDEMLFFGKTNQKSPREVIVDILSHIGEEANHTTPAPNKKNFKQALGKNKSREDFKRSVQHFIIYQIYKIMNPRRIAGETKKDNYIHNLYMGRNRDKKLDDKFYIKR
jgi:hypothetical protein